VILACSRDGGMLSYRIPNDWKNPEKVKVSSINEDGSLTAVKFNIIDRYLKFNTEPNAPYRVVYDLKSNL